jgi:hypothetical protein
MSTKLIASANFNTQSQIWEIDFVGKISELIQFQENLNKDKFLLASYLKLTDQKLLNSSIFSVQNSYLAIFGSAKVQINLQTKILREVIGAGVAPSKVYLVGPSWLKLDLDGVPKSDQAVDLIFFENKIFKTLTSQKLFSEKMQEQVLPTGSLLWKIKV